MQKAHQVDIREILPSETLVLHTSHPVPTHGPSLEPLLEVHHLPTEVKLSVNREIVFLRPCRLSKGLVHDANRQNQYAVSFIKQGRPS